MKMSYVLRILVVSASYFSTAKLGQVFAVVDGNVTLVWPPTGIAIAALLLFGYRMLPAIGLGAFLTSASTGVPLGFVLAAVIGTLLEASTAVYVLRRSAFHNTLDRFRDVVIFVMTAGVLSTMFSATIGAAGLCFTGMAPWAAYPSIWWQWWVGNMMGALIVTPVLLTWASQPNPFGRRSVLWWLEIISVFIAGLVATYFVFGIRHSSHHVNLALLYLPFPVLLWVGLRFGPRGATTMTLLVTTIAVLATAHGSGPFVETSVNESLFLLWAFMGITSVTALMVASIIAERRTVEAALRRSEARWRSLTEYSPTYVVTVDTQLNISFVNRASPGLTIDALIGTPLYTYVDPERQETVKSILEGVLATGKKTSYETVFHSPDGDIYYESIVGPQMDGERISGLTVSSYDVTHHKQAEQELQQEKTFTDAILDSLPGVFFVINAEGRFLRWNINSERLTGYSGDELASLQALDLIVETQRQSIAGEIAKVFEYGETTVEIDLMTKDDTTTPYFFIGRRVWTDNTPVGLAIGIDLTDRKRAEANVRQSEAQLYHIINTVPEGVILLDAQHHVLLANPLAEQFLSVLSPDRPENRLTMLGDRPLNAFLTSLPRGLWHEVSVDQQTFEAVARPIESSAANTGWVLVLRDVTQEKIIQRHVHGQERLAAVGQLAAGIAHDFNNILAVMSLSPELILRTVELPERAKERLNIIIQQAQRAKDLVQQILDFSRQSVLEQRPLDLVPYMQELIRLFERTIPEDIEITLQYAEGDYIIQADPSRIQQVMMNLVVNARDAMPEGGRLQIRLKQTRIGEDKPPRLPEMPAGDWIQIEVADTGGGIPQEVLLHVFEPFFTTKDVGKGTGLGLAQVYGIVKQHDGYIDVTSEVGQGTTFFLYFPAFSTTGAQATETSDGAELQYGSGQTILLVEDDPTTRQVLVDSLVLLNYQVIEAANGRHALAILTTSSDSIRCVVSDVVMPEMGGIALLHALRQHNLMIPVMLITGHPLHDQMENLQALGLKGWLLKPPDLPALSRMLAQILG